MSGAAEASILVLNVGSSTLKFGVFPLVAGDDPFLRGVVEYAGPNAGQVRTTDSVGRGDSRQLDFNRDSGPAQLIQYLEQQHSLASIRAVGHRLVHGGTTLVAPVRIDLRVRAMLEDLVPLAPDHLPMELRAIDEVSRLSSSLVQIACFDTAFHSGMPSVARIFGLPRHLSNSGVVRYGFHGLSYEYVTSELRRLGELPQRVIAAHLGSGASLVALRDGVSIDTSMGMTPAGGIAMSTRSGDLDPGVILFLLRSRNFSISALDDAVNREGGLLGISELSSDVRELFTARSTDTGAAEAIDVFCYQAKKCIGSFAAALGGLDALVFSGGIGEHSPEAREQICKGLEFLGIAIDPALNDANAPLISAHQGGVQVRIVNTREEVMIARHVRAVLANNRIS